MTESQPIKRTPEFLFTEQAVSDRWFLRPKEVAEHAGLGVQTVREAIYRGELQARKFRGRGWLITEDAARRWIEEQTVPNTERIA